MNDFKQFLTDGVINGVSLGAKKSELLKIWGKPPSWKGMTSSLTHGITSMKKSPFWYYYDESVAISGGTLVDSMRLFPKRLSILYGVSDVFSNSPRVWSKAHIEHVLHTHGILIETRQVEEGCYVGHSKKLLLIVKFSDLLSYDEEDRSLVNCTSISKYRTGSLFDIALEYWG